MTDETLERLILVIDGHSEPNAMVSQLLHPTPGHYRLERVDSGDAALAALRQVGDFSAAARPDLVLLDLSLPDAESLAILAAIKGDANLRRIPVIVLAESDCSEHVFQSYFNQGNCYVVKAADADQLTAIVERIEAFWLDIVTLPMQ